ncbi:hypothetical protein BOFE_08790 (plasmid) [Candidatus Borrelia fainii]|uniref:Lipoprotein n=1 Tax=Candidatus Borrelia fainii TaxID=2518322 RepID=A0ABM8DL74_9SPIR|nr:hypothetical protein [Candidatus Borrelia fainii]BDU63339.1 hypothetical protein BOFE_08790 [Candidatus Borrelia fainii]
MSMKRFSVILCMLGLVLGCVADGESATVFMECRKTEKPCSISMLVPFLQDTLIEAYNDLKSLVEHFRNQIVHEYFDNPLDLPLSMGVLSKLRVHQLSNYGMTDYGIAKSNRRLDSIYVALGCDLTLMQVLIKDIFAKLNLKPGPHKESKDIAIASMLLFNLEQVSYYTFLLKNILSDEKLNKVRISSAATIENISQITSWLFSFMQAKDDLIRDFRKVISGAAAVKDNRQLMEAELKKIVDGGKIKSKINDISILVRDIQNLVTQITKVVN